MNKRLDTSCAYIVDDDEAVRDSISLLLDSVGIANQNYGSAQEFIDAFIAGEKVKAPGVIVLDIRMPGINGLECQQKLNQLNCHLPIIFITGHGDVPMAVEAMKNGAVEFVQKPFRDQDLLDRVQEHLKASEESWKRETRELQVLQKLASLTPREKEVLDNIVQGKANKVIALELNVSQRTVEIHRANVMEKMSARSLAELVTMVVQTESS